MNPNELQKFVTLGVSEAIKAAIDTMKAPPEGHPFYGNQHVSFSAGTAQAAPRTVAEGAKEKASDLITATAPKWEEPDAERLSRNLGGPGGVAEYRQKIEKFKNAASEAADEVVKRFDSALDKIRNDPAAMRQWESAAETAYNQQFSRLYGSNSAPDVYVNRGDGIAITSGKPYKENAIRVTKNIIRAKLEKK